MFFKKKKNPSQKQEGEDKGKHNPKGLHLLKGHILERKKNQQENQQAQGLKGNIIKPQTQHTMTPPIPKSTDQTQQQTMQSINQSPPTIQQSQTQEQTQESVLNEQIIPPPTQSLTQPSQTTLSQPILSSQTPSSPSLQTTQQTTQHPMDITQSSIEEKRALFEPFRQETMGLNEEKPQEYHEEPQIPEPTDIPEPTEYEGLTSDLGLNIDNKDFDKELSEGGIDESLFDESSFNKEVGEKKEKFISLESYKEVLKELNHLKRLFSTTESMIDDVIEQISVEDKKLEDFKARVEDVERKIMLIDKLLFNEE